MGRVSLPATQASELSVLLINLTTGTKCVKLVYGMQIYKQRTRN